MLNAAKLLDPQDTRTLTNLGGVLMNMERFDEAEASLRAALKIEPNYAEAHFVLGTMYQRLYQHDMAIKAFRQFRFLDTDTQWSVLNLATAYEDIGLTEQAIRLFELYLERSNQGTKWSGIRFVINHDRHQ